ncbi:MAG: hypothetical protein H0U27_10970, partial [Nitrosopumilus sp.]|nr:hypothetical protein [Nitrosopumilus sp.]
LKKEPTTRSRNNLASVIAIMKNIGISFVRFDSKANKFKCYPNTFEIPKENVPRYEKKKEVKAWCDASHSISGAGGGIAVQEKGVIKGLSFKIPKTTSSTQAELYTNVKYTAVALLCFEKCNKLNLKIDNKTAAKINDEETKNMFNEFWKEFSKLKKIRAESNWTKGHSSDKMNVLADKLADEGKNDDMIYIHSTILKTLKDQTFIFDGDHLNPNWRKKVHDYYQNKLERVDDKYHNIKDHDKYAKISFQHLDDHYDSFTSTILNNMRSDTFAKLWDLKNKTRHKCSVCNIEATIEHVMIECPLVYDSIERLEEKIETILNQFGSKKRVELFWEDDEQKIRKDKIAIGIRGMIPKESMKKIANSIRIKEKRQKENKEKLIKRLTRELKRCIYVIHKEIARFGWNRVKCFWKNNKQLHNNHHSDDDFNEEEAILLRANLL